VVLRVKRPDYCGHDWPRHQRRTAAHISGGYSVIMGRIHGQRRHKENEATPCVQRRGVLHLYVSKSVRGGVGFAAPLIVEPLGGTFEKVRLYEKRPPTMISE
jgi:hypothetical protein